MGVYTKTGDAGQTGLYTGERIAKDSLRVEAYGSVDESNAALAMARAFCQKQEVLTGSASCRRTTDCSWLILRAREQSRS